MSHIDEYRREIERLENEAHDAWFRGDNKYAAQCEARIEELEAAIESELEDQRAESDL